MSTATTIGPAHLRVVSKTENTLFDPFFRQFVEALDIAVYATDVVGRIVYFNEAAVDFWGVRPELDKHEFCGSWKLYWPDGSVLPHNECPMAIALRERRPVRGYTAIAERPDGTRVPFTPYPTPIFDSSGELIGAVNMLIEVSDQHKAEADTHRLAAIVESSNDAIISKDLNGIITTWNGEAERLFGYTAAEAIGKPVTMLIPADRQDEEPGIIERIRKSERIEHYETVRRRKDGSLVEISITVSPIKDRNGRVVGASKIARDITERRQAEATTTLLLNEMKHRVRNTLATVQGLAHQSFRGSAAELSVFGARLNALAGAHDTMTKEWDRAPLLDILDRALSPFAKERFRIEGGKGVFLDAGNALSLTMALHELATNAVKYGSLSQEGGQVDVTANVQDRSLRLTWTETGGPPVSPPTRQGFGSRLIKSNFRNGKVRLDFAPTGLVCTLEIPV
jgi:PAS domain S-box-containing protein